MLVPTLLYGSETWVLQKKKEIKINGVEMQSLRKIYRVSLADRIRNEEIHRMAGTSEDVTMRMKKKLSISWFGHVERMSVKKWQKRVMKEK